MTHAPRAYRRETETIAPRRAAPGEVALRPFTTIEVRGDLASAMKDWRELEAGAGAYQTYEFADAWAAEMGQGVALAIVVARDDDGRPVALLPLRLRRVGPLLVARFVGGSWANYHMGLFRPGLVWRLDDVRAMLGDAARQRGIDLFCFAHQPQRWEGTDNPLALLPGRPSPNTAFATSLPGSLAEWLDEHFSRATQKKLRKKARKLEAFGEVAHRRADSPDEAARFLDAFFSHKAAQARARGETNIFTRPAVPELLRRLVAGRPPVMEMHALVAGERIVATFGALPGGRRLSGLIISYEVAPDVAAASPGEQLLVDVAREAIARGFTTLDLGVGASRYKGEICEIEEVLFDAAFGVSALGRLAAPLYHVWRGAKGELKRRPRLLSLAETARQFLFR